MPAAECGFGYRTSGFSYHDRHVVLSVTFRLRQDDHSARSATPSSPARSACRSPARAPLTDVREAVLRLRRGKGMVIDPADPDSVSAGSFFTNPVLRCSRPTGGARPGRSRTAA